MAEIVKLRAKQTVNNALYYRNGPNTALVHNLSLNSKVLIQRKSGNQTGPYRLLAVEDETCYVQLSSGLTNFRSTSVKPYFRPKYTYDVEPEEPEVPVELDKLKAPTKLEELEAPVKPDELEAPAKLDKLEVPLPTLEVPYKPTKPTKTAVKRS